MLGKTYLDLAKLALVACSFRNGAGRLIARANSTGRVRTSGRP